MTRDEIVAQLESLALHAGAPELGDARDMLTYTAAAIRVEAERQILETIAIATARAIAVLEERKRKEASRD